MSYARRSQQLPAPGRARRRVLLTIACCAILGFAASAGTVAVAASSEPTGVTRVAAHHRSLDAVANSTRIDVTRHVVNRPSTRRTAVWALAALAALVLVVGLSATSVRVDGERRRGRVVRLALPARAPPHPALG